MAGCKFWKPELFKQTQRIANEFVVKAFADQWKRVEVVQAFACMTYWKEPEDTVGLVPLLAESLLNILFRGPIPILAT